MSSDQYFGPWQDHLGNAANRHLITAKVDGSIHLIAGVDTKLPGWSKRATLIAAAPDMGTALKQAASDVHDFRLDMENGLEPSPERLNAIACKLEAVMEKAGVEWLS